jgi:phospholipid/cholesterol/gamma-HCH transport system substrate-binding protein
VAEIDQAAPISASTTAELSLLSVATGLLYIDLQQNTRGREVLPAVPSERYPVIRTVRSTFDTFLESLPDLAGSAAVLLDRAQEIFSPENSRALADMVRNLHEASSGLPATMQHIDSLVASMNQTSNEVRQLAGQLRATTGDLTPKVQQIAQRLNRTAEQLEQASRGIETFVSENRAGVAQFTRDGLPQLQRTLEEARNAAEAFQELSRSLKDNPSQLLYQPAQGGVKVKR